MLNFLCYFFMKIEEGKLTKFFGSYDDFLEIPIRYEDEKNKVVFCNYHVRDIDKFDSTIINQRVKGVYLQTGIFNGNIYTYSGKSETPKGSETGVFLRIKQHEREGDDPKNKNNPNYANRKYLKQVSTILNIDSNSSNPLNNEIISSLEHIYYLIMAQRPNNLNSASKTAFHMSNDGYDLFDYIYPIMNSSLNAVEGTLKEVLTLKYLGEINSKLGIKKSQCKKPSFNERTEGIVYKFQDTILENSYFELDLKTIRYDSSARDLLTDLILAGVCCPYPVKNKTCIVFLKSLNLDESFSVRNTSRNINEDTMDLLLGCRKVQKTWIKA